MTFIPMPMPMPMPKTVCIIHVYNEIVQLEVCITLLGRGVGMNITAQRSAPVQAYASSRAYAHAHVPLGRASELGRSVGN